MNISVVGITDVGLKRDNNEDAFLALSETENSGPANTLMIVADGMGGLSKGEVASQTAIEVIHSYITENATGQNPSQQSRLDLLTQAFLSANTQIFTQEETALSGSMGTTCTVANILEKTLFIAHAGDSRAYLLRAHKLEQLTTDDSWVMEQVVLGNLTEDQARFHPSRNIITQALGIRQDVDIETLSLNLNPNDRILLCSDGLTGLVEDTEIKRILMENSLEDAANRLIDTAKSLGGNDNITVVIGDVHR